MTLGRAGWPEIGHSESVRERAIAMLSDGLVSRTRAATLLGIPRQTVNNWATQAGIPSTRNYRTGSNPRRTYYCTGCGKKVNRRSTNNTLPCPSCGSEVRLSPSSQSADSGFVLDRFDVLPIQLLCCAAGCLNATDQARFLGVSRETWTRALNDGDVSYVQADKFANRLKRHPCSLWPDWFAIRDGFVFDWEKV